MSHTVVGIFESRSAAETAQNYLINNGFSSQDVDLNTAGVAANDSLAGTANGQLPVSAGDVSGYTTAGTNDNEDSVSGFFKHLFSSHDDEQEGAETIRQHVQASHRGVIVTVHARSEEKAQMAANTLDEHGAIDVDEFSKASSTAALPKTGTTDHGKIEVIEESLQVGKQEVESGGVRLRSRIVARPVEESIRLREEHVSVQRTATNRPTTEADFTAFKEGTVEVTEHAERAVVGKEARVVEEVSLSKAVSEKEEMIKDTVRHTEVDTEKIVPKSSR